MKAAPHTLTVFDDELDGLRALVCEIAERIAAMDDAVDRYHACISRALVDLMGEDPRHIAGATELLFVSHKLERIGDHAVGIAAMVGFAAGKDR